MKKGILLIIAILGLIGLGWYALKLSATDGQSDKELIDFAIQDVTTVDKVIITDRTGQSFEIHKQGGIWTDKDGGCISQESAEFVIDAFKNIEFKGYLSDNSHKKFESLMSAQHTKVEIFQNGDWTKTWYIGPSSQDHYGQVMLLDSDEYGKSDYPVLMKIKGLNGILEPRFFADPRKWACTDVFRIPREKISKVDVQFFDEPERSFTVTKKGSEMHVYQQGKELQNVAPKMFFTYLNNYQRIHYNVANYELTPAQIDSVKRSMPFATLEVTETNNKKTTLRFFRLQYKQENTPAGMGEVLDMDRDKFWCELNDGTMVKCQYFVFNPLLLGHVYFPMDVSMLNTEDGIREK